MSLLHDDRPDALPPVARGETPLGSAAGKPRERGAMVVKQDSPMSRTELLQILASANAATVQDLASEIARLKAHSSSLQALLRSSGASLPSPDGLDGTTADNQEHERLQQCLADLARAQAAIAALSQSNQGLRLQHAALAEKIAGLEAHNQLLTESATAQARLVQEQEGRLAQATGQVTDLSSHKQRLQAEHQAISQRLESVEDHNRLLTQSAIDTALKLRECEGKLAEALTDIAKLSRDNEYIRVEHALQAQRAAEFEAHNQVLTNRVTELGLRDRVLVERTAELEDSIKFLTDSLTERARQLQQEEAKRTEARVEIATLLPEMQRLQGEHAALSRRAAELDDHNRLLTQSAIETTLKLQDSETKLADALAKIERARPMELAYNPYPRFTRWVVERNALSSAFVLVDVGVQGGIHPRWNALGEALHVEAFDPLVEAIEPLAAQERPHHRYHALALSDEDGERDFFVPQALAAASFHPRGAAQDQARMVISAANWENTETRRVTARRLDTLMADGVLHRADFLKLDCEGFEPAVLRGARQFLASAGLLGIDCEIGFSSIHWPETHFLAVYEQITPHGFRLFDIAFNRVPFRRYFERARELGREAEASLSVSFPGSFNVLFSHTIASLRQRPTWDEVLKRAIIFELYGMLDVAYDLLQFFSASMPPGFPLQEGADLLIPE